MKKAFYKKIALPLLFVTAFPITSIFCCCMEQAQAAEPAFHHSHSDSDTKSGHDHGSADSSKSAHDHAQCDHEELVANLTQNSKVFLSLNGFLPNFLSKPFLIRGEFPVYPAFDSSPPLDTGPPGIGSFSTPLYLQISILRI